MEGNFYFTFHYFVLQPTNSFSEQNHKDVLIAVDSQDYPALIESFEGDQDDQQFRRKLAWKAFQHCASYDSAVSEWLWKQTVGGILLILLL
jgi:phosphoribosylaminoimidazolecarboxamide formyltransferase/IMP cyclohydrolase